MRIKFDHHKDTNITMALYNFIHNDIQLKAPKWIQQQKINEETKGERTHL